MQQLQTMGERLTDLRKKKGEKQDDIKELLNVSRATVANYENGNRTPDYQTLVCLADHFGVTCDYLIRGVRSSYVDIHNTTGLSDKSISILRNMRLADATYYYDMLNYLIEETAFISYEDGSCRHQESVLLNLIQYCLFELPTDKGSFIVSSEGDMIDAADCDESDIELVTDNHYPISDEEGAYYIEKISKAKLVEAYKFERLTEMIKKSKAKYLKQKGEKYGNHRKEE